MVNKADYQSINAVSAARATIGLDAEILELRAPLRLIARMEHGIAVGDVINWKELVAQVNEHEFDALGIATPITIDNETLAAYWRHGGVNPVGGVEAIATRLIGEALDKPCAHGPVDYALTGFKEVVDPRIAVEIITENFIHCLLKGLHKASHLSTRDGLSNRDVDCMVSPYGCFGAPHQACLDAGIPVIVVRENSPDPFCPVGPGMRLMCAAAAEMPREPYLSSPGEAGCHQRRPGASCDTPGRSRKPTCCYSCGGRSTASMTWITPLEARTFDAATRTPLTYTFLRGMNQGPLLEKRTSSPWRVSAERVQRRSLS